MAEPNVEQYPSLFNRPRNLILLPVLIGLHQVAACTEVAYGISFSSLAFFTHGTQLGLNGVMLLSRFLSVLATWHNERYYSLSYVGPSIKLNFAVSLVSGCFAILYFYMALHSLFIAPAVELDAKSFLIPFPGILAALGGIYAVLSAYEWPEQSIAERKSAERTYHHLLSCIFGSFGVALACIEIYAFGFVVADAICTLCNAALIFMSAMSLARESIERSIALRKGDLFFMRSYSKDNFIGLNNVFNF